MSQGKSGPSVAVVICIVLGVLGLMGALIVILGAMFMYSGMDQVRKSANRAQSMNHLKQIVLALHNHEATHRRLPSPEGSDRSDGQPPRSWRVDLLPYLEYQALYQQYDKDATWSSPENRGLLEQMPRAYQTPGETLDGTLSNTAFVLVTGPGTIFPHDREPLKFSEISDGMSNTVICIQLPTSDIPWLEPRDVDIEMLLEMFANPNGPIKKQGGINVGFADGSVRFISADIQPNTLRAILTADGGELAEIP